MQSLAHATLAGSFAGQFWRRASLFGSNVGLRVPAIANVRDYGARGDGIADDTPAFSRATAALPRSGGTVLVPDGVYLMNPLQSIVLRDGITLHMSAGATLKAIPVGESHYAIVQGLNVNNIAILGGTILGERAQHSSAGGEWGMGINILGCTDVHIQDVQIRDCWGDGIYVGAGRTGESQHVVIQGCSAINNRRQGLSVTGCIDATIEDCHFLDTHGTAPQSGIDLEPNGRYVVRDITITKCEFERNRGFGLVMAGANVTAVGVRECQCVDNGQAGIVLAHASNCVVENNVIEHNGNTGVSLNLHAHDNQFAGNTIYGNSRTKPGNWDNVALAGGASNNTFSDNVFKGVAGQLGETARFDIRVYGPDCVGNRLLRNAVRTRKGPAGGIDDHGANTTIVPASPNQ